MDFLQTHLDFLLAHLLSITFWAFLIEAAGIPFPSRILLLVVATLIGEPRELALLAAAASAGALIGDHVPYLAGSLTGVRILGFYCRITLGSERCVEQTVGYFRRFGAAAILLSRFSTGVRLFAAAMSGCGHIAYWRFLVFDVLGTLLYTALWVTVGRLVGQRAIDFFRSHGNTRWLLLAGPLALVALIAYRLWRRSRYGPVNAELLSAQSASCIREQGDSC